MDSLQLARQARRLLHSVEGDLERYLGYERLDRDLVGELYIQVSEVLGRAHRDEPDAAGVEVRLVDDLAMSIYLVTLAREPRKLPSAVLLADLRKTIEATLEIPAANAVAADGESRDPDAEGTAG